MNNKTIIISFLCLIATILGPQTLHAVSADDFNPNYIISDAEMQDKNTMDRSDISVFLEEKNSYLSTFKTSDWEGQHRTAADIIYRASQEHNINPKYLLVKLQKEQSLITDKTPTDNQLNGATGYGITDGCGWSCDMYLNNKGFGKQVDKAAGVIRWYYDHKGEESWIKQANNTYTIDGQRITPQSDATAFLYTYTPHIQGNQNFWLLWQNWFANQAYPDGTLLQALGEDTVYIIEDGKKRAFTTKVALNTRVDARRIITVPTTEINRYDTGHAISLANYSILKQGSKHYLLDFDTIRPFADAQTVRQLGYHPDEIIEVSTADIAHFTLGKTITAETDAPLGRLVRPEDGVLYYMKDDTIAPIVDDSMAEINFPYLDIEETSFAELGSKTLIDPVLFTDGTLILVKGYNSVYVIEHGKKRHIASEEVFNGLGYKWDQIIRISSMAGSIHQTGSPLYLDRTISKEPLIAQQPKGDEESENITTPQKTISSMQKTDTTKTVYTGPTFETDIDAYTIYDVKTDTILASKNADVVRPLASLTKVMTTYETIMQGLRVNTAGTYEAADHKAMYHYFRITEGEKIMYRDLLDAALVSSLNTPVRMLVDAVEEDEDVFIASLNTQAKEWGLNNTHFTSVTGERETTVGTANDYAYIFKKAMFQKTLKSYLSKTYYAYDEALDIDGKKHHYDYHSNELLERTDLPYKIEGSKTGYLPESGANLAMMITRPSDGKQFIVITLGNPEITKRFEEPDALVRWAIKTF
ncbi:serine hydrolase [Patescibacteria group bacterium]|nr:serine hydrolase [Patescibacteria group bacterium]MBU1721460.1 serine hydrolase [Patescibacteria group bacterium]MBU1900783.1 serine hydrolase [Patescibacteria group bacterium]